MRSAAGSPQTAPNSFSPDRIVAPATTAERQRIRRLVARHDGSTMRLLETLTDRPVAVTLLGRCRVRAGSSATRLRVGEAESLVRRRIELRAAGTVLVAAVAEIVPSRLPDALSHALTAGVDGIGTLLARLRIETFRETAEPMPYPGTGELRRRYRLFMRSVPVADIVERFDLNALEALCGIED